MSKVEFIVGGAARAGTTSIYQVISQFASMPEQKFPEPNFFFKDSEYAKGVKYYENLISKGYEQDGRPIGEVSTSTLFGEKCAERIYHYNPKMKLVFVLRNPIERILSQYSFSVGNGIEPLSVADAVELDLKNDYSRTPPELLEVRPFEYIGRSRYGACLKRFFDVFPACQILLLNFERLTAQPKPSIENLLGFLGVEATTEIEFPKSNSAPRQSNNSSLEPHLEHLRETFSRDMPILEAYGFGTGDWVLA